MKTETLLFGGAAAVGAVLLGRYAYNTYKLSHDLQTDTQVNVYSVSLTGVTLQVDVTLKNPTAGTVNVKYPFIKLMYGSATLASSEPKDASYILPKFGQLKLPSIFIPVSFITLGLTAPALLLAYRQNQGIVLTMKTSTYVNSTLPVERTDNITIYSKADGSKGAKKN